MCIGFTILFSLENIRYLQWCRGESKRAERMLVMKEAFKINKPNEPKKQKHKTMA